MVFQENGKHTAMTIVLHLAIGTMNKSHLIANISNTSYQSAHMF